MNIAEENMNKENIAFENQPIFQNTLISGSFDKSYEKRNKHYCEQHLQTIGQRFCTNCISYNLCDGCVKSKHSGHQILKFDDESKLIAGTRQFLLETMQETLKTLKAKQNEMKNKITQLKLVKNNLKTQQEQIMSSLSNMFQSLQQQLSTLIRSQEQKYEKQVDNFYREYDQINDRLRDNLMLIIDGQINIRLFKKQMVIEKPPSFPNFSKYKNSMEKVKKTYKQMKQYINGMNEKIKSMQSHQNSRGEANSKFEKYLETKNSKNYDKVNESFMGMLRLMDNKQNVPVLNMKRIQNL